MKASAVPLTLLLLGLSTGLAAQPYPYAPRAGDGYYAPGALPAVPSPANPASRPMPQRLGNPVAEATATLEKGMGRLLDFLAENTSANKLQVAAFLDREIAPYFDFEYMAQWVAGPAYGAMSDKERSDLVAWLESDFLSVLASNLGGYEGQQIRMLSPRRGPRGAVSIKVAILRPGNYPATLQFRMAPSAKGWRVYDVVADGQSAAAFYRVQFQRMAGQMPAAAR